MSAATKLAREYELIYILRPAAAPSDAKKVAERVSDVLEKLGAKALKVDNWGKRRLAYPIKKHSRGIFVYVRFAGGDGVVAELERNLRIFDSVIRYQTIRLEGLYDLGELEIDPEEVKFLEIEESGEEDEEPSYEERLGLVSRSRRRDEREAAESDDDDDDDDDDDAPAARKRAAPKSEPAEAESAEAESAEAESAEAESAEAESAEAESSDPKDEAKKTEAGSSDESSGDDEEE